MSNYLDTIYSKERRPESNYPFELASKIQSLLGISLNGKTLLDFGCGRGDMLKAFHSLGAKVFGVDGDKTSINYCLPHTVKISNFESDGIDYEDNFFDVIFSKSVIEHIVDYKHYLQQASNAMKKDGHLIILTPSWLHHGWGPFYLDASHVTPFTMPSLIDCLNMQGFDVVYKEEFYQLPLYWRYPYLRFLTSIVQRLPLKYAPMYDVKINPSLNKFIRFSKEAMLLVIVKKKGT